MTEWTKEEWQQAQRSLDLYPGTVSMNYLAILRTCQRNRLIAAAKDTKERLACEDIAGAYRILNTAITACTEGK